MDRQKNYTKTMLLNLTDNEKVNKIKELQEANEALISKNDELEFEQSMFHELLSTIPDNIYFKDRKSRFTILSKAMMEWFGRQKIDQVIGKTDFDMFTEEHAKEAYKDEQRIMKTGEPIINKEEKETWEGGKITWVSTSKVPIRGKNGKIIGIVGISRDITEKKRTETILKEYQKNLENAKQETDNILATVEEGLFLLDINLDIGTQYSLELKSIIGEKEPANKNFIDLLTGKLEKSVLESSRDYLNLLFDESNDEAMLLELNPLIEVKAQINQKTKYLTFKFRRVAVNSEANKQLIAIVSDVTKEVSLSKSLKKQEAENKRKMDWLLCILNIDPIMLKEFISSVHEELSNIDDNFETFKKNMQDFDAFDSIYRSIHTIKGSARLLEMNFFADLAHTVENVLAEFREKRKLTKTDQKNLKIQIGSIHQMYEELKDLIEDIGKIHDQFRPKRSHENKLLLNTLEKLIANLSSEYNKEVTFDYEKFDGTDIPFQRRLIVRDILVQLIRNSMHHGLESVEEREKQNKPNSGKIQITGHAEDNAYIIQFEDDGRGLNSKKLEEKAKKAGIWSNDEIAGWSKEKLYETIFHAGITTSDEVNLTAGRGMGMSIIKTILEKVGGEIKVETSPGKFTRFEVLIPFAQE
ncbi:MAG: PAS domain-containing protein [Calditrichaceae bacterium]